MSISSGLIRALQRFHRRLPFRALAFFTILAVAFGVAEARSPHHPSGRSGFEAAARAGIPVGDLPREARDTLSRIKSGGPFPFSKDGVIFGNREGRLPRMKGGYYTEYTVRTPGSHDRGARRIIAGAGPMHDPRTSGEYYYTDDHYRTFRKIVER